MLDDLLDAFGGTKDRNAKSSGNVPSGGWLGRIGRMLEGGDDSDGDRDEEGRSRERYPHGHGDARYRRDDRRRGASMQDEIAEDGDSHRGDSRGRQRRDFDPDFGD